MITVYLKKSYKTGWFIVLPHEINNEFLWNAWRAARDWEIHWVNNIPSFNDFWVDVEFPIEKLDNLYNDFEILERNLDGIIKIVPLPKKIWWWESYPIGFISFYEEWIEEFKKYFPESTQEYIDWIISYKSYIEEPTQFTKEDILLIISLIKKKILEAKEKWETLVFSGD